MKRTLSIALLQCGLIVFACSSFAVTDLFKADFENCPSVPGVPMARVGSFSSTTSGTNFTVVSSGGGFSNVCMRLAAPGDFVGQTWNYTHQPRTGSLTVQWDMNIVSYPTSSPSFVAFFIYFETVTNYMFPPAASLYFRTNGILSVENVISSVPYQENVIHRYRYEHDLFTGELSLWMDGQKVARSDSPFRTQYAYARIILMTHSSYRGTVWVDNVQASYTQPWIPSLWASFDLNANGPFAAGELLGYPVHDWATEVQVDGYAFVTNPTSLPYDKALCVAATNFVLNLMPNRAFEDGEYLFQCGLKRLTTNSTVSFVLEQGEQPVVAVHYAGTNLFAYSNATLHAVQLARAGSSYEYDVTLQVDTRRSLYDMKVDGVSVFSNWPVCQTGIPTGVKIRIADPTASTNYLDDIGLAMRGRGGVYVLKTTIDECSMLLFDPAARQLERTSVIATGMPSGVYLTDIAFGAQGYLYGTDVDGPAIRVYDPRTWTQVGSCSSPMDAPNRIVCFRDGQMAVLDGYSIFCFTGGPSPSYKSTLVETVSNGANRLCASYDEKTLFVGTAHQVFKYGAQDGAYLGELASVSGLPGLQISDMATAPDGRLYILDGPRTNLLYFDGVNDAYEGTIQGVSSLQRPSILGVMNNGNLLVGDLADSKLHEFDAFTGETLGSYDSSPYSLAGAYAILEPPPLQIVRFQNAAYTNFTIEVDGDPGRFYSLGQSSNLLEKWTYLSPDILATNGRPVFSYTNDRPSEFRCLSVFESGL
ncbi:MAG TPA: hypothetical protein DCZ95_17605 [Verrucomicrobia bacterium]|nr:hypothetical protein [Verrucomicrobiota bacterium]